MIPLKIRKKISEDHFYKRCIHKDKESGKECYGRITIEHSYLYKGKQIQELWSLVPCCWFHHLGNGLEKEYNKYRALTRSDIDDLCRRMPKKDWKQELKYLTSKYENKD